MREGKLGKAVFKVTRLTVAAIYHSTEDPVKVRKALLGIIPETLRGRVGVKEVITKGYYGDLIGVLTTELVGREALNALTYIICSLPLVDRQILKATIDSRVGVRPSHLHLRLSKQDAFLGKLTLLDGDDVIKISTTITGVRSVGDLKLFISDLISKCGEIGGLRNPCRSED